MTGEAASPVRGARRLAGGPRRRGARVVLAGSAVLAAGAATAAATGLGFGAPGGGGAGSAQGGLPPATAAVTRQTLVDTQIESGELGYGSATTVTGRLDGTLTALPAPGSKLDRGDAVYRVDNTPVVLLYGKLPAYRPLSPGTRGPDVKQFEQNLSALGYAGFTADDSYTDSTATAVKQWQKDLGLPGTGVVDLGRIVYAPGAVRVDARKVAVGDAAQPGQPVLTYTGSERVVVAELDVADQRLAARGAAVSVSLPGGRAIPGKITKVETVIKPAEGNNPAATKIDVTVTVADKKALSGLDQASVDVAFTAARRENVLSVPVAALLALAEGGYGVQVVDGASTRMVAVRTGLFAAGRVEVSGDGLVPGATVGMPS